MTHKRNTTEWTPFANLEGLVRLVLLIDWDPIGILGHIEAMDEYDSYAANICEILLSGASSDMLAAHLAYLERQLMNMSGDPQRLMVIAEKLIIIYNTILQDEELNGLLR